MPIEVIAKITSTATLTSVISQRNRPVEQAEERRLGAERHDRERGKRGRRRHERREREQDRVGRLRLQLLLEEQLDDVGERLQQRLRTRPGSGRCGPGCRRRPSAPARP